MSTVATREVCLHPSMPRGGLVQCADCHGLFRDDKKLVSVSKIVGMLPQEPCSECKFPMWGDHDPRGCSVKKNIENAKERGSQVDALFSAYVMGKLSKFPIGTRDDSEALFNKLADWFDKQRFTDVEAQVLVGDDEVGGVLDLRVDGMILDIKAVYDPSPTHAIQVAGYAFLGNADRCGILHVTARHNTPRLITLDRERVVDDFLMCRQMWRTAERLKRLKL